RPFDTAASLSLFIAVTGIAIPAAVNFAVIGLQVAIGWFDDPWLWWLQWTAAGYFFTITLPPLVVLLAQGGFSGRPRAPLALRLEIAAAMAALLATSLFVFGGGIDLELWPAAYLAPLPLLLWAAARFGVGGTALALLTVAAGADRLPAHLPRGDRDAADAARRADGRAAARGGTVAAVRGTAAVRGRRVRHRAVAMGRRPAAAMDVGQLPRPVRPRRRRHG